MYAAGPCHHQEDHNIEGELHWLCSFQYESDSIETAAEGVTVAILKESPFQKD
jgi:hypothetical protein